MRKGKREKSFGKQVGWDLGEQLETKLMMIKPQPYICLDKKDRPYHWIRIII